MTKRILISGLGGSLFPYLHEKIKDRFDPYYVDSNESLKRIYPNLRFFRSPLVRDLGYQSFVTDLIKENKIEAYLPLIDEEILLANKVIRSVPGLQLISPDPRFSELCLNKYELMLTLRSMGVSQIESWTGDKFVWGDQKSIFVKPIQGRGSRGIRHIQSPQELEAYNTLERYAPEDVLIQEYVGGTEYTVGLTTNRNNDILAITPKKVLSKKGITIEAVIDNHPKIIELCNLINSKMQPKGPINIQLFLTEDQVLKIFEINPRFSTTSIMSFEAGIDEISLFLDYADKPFRDEPKLATPGLRLIRRWENLFYAD